MVSKRGYLAIVATLLVATTGGPIASVATSQPAPVSPQQSPPTECDYAALYDQTVDSVVGVRTEAGLGSGFVHSMVDDDASYVVTNAHVVGDASTVTVQFTGQEAREGTVVGRDRQTDLAVVRVSDTPADVEPLRLAEERPEHGQAVAALGNPFGLEETITHGIVSGLNRSMPTQFGFAIPDTIQTDAPISSGNSGGPLVTCDGRVVGVTTAGIAAPTAENIGFAVSSTIVGEVVPDLIETGEFDHPYLGVSVAPVGPAAATAYNLTESTGVVVRSVQPDAPAADVLQGATGTEIVSGQRVAVGGDVIVAVNGTTIQSPEDLSSTLITQTEPGDEVPITVVRDGQRTTLNVTITERPTPEVA